MNRSRRSFCLAAVSPGNSSSSFTTPSAARRGSCPPLFQPLLQLQSSFFSVNGVIVELIDHPGHVEHPHEERPEHSFGRKVKVERIFDECGSPHDQMVEVWAPAILTRASLIWLYTPAR